MIELSYFHHDDGNPQGADALDCLEKRFPQLLADARKFAEEGWSIGLTAGGIKVREQIDSLRDGAYKCQNDPGATLPLFMSAWGVKTPYAPSGQTRAEIEGELEWCRDLLHHRIALHHASTEVHKNDRQWNSIIAKIEKKRNCHAFRAWIVKKCGKEGQDVNDEYADGKIAGWVEALAWVLGRD